MQYFIKDNEVAAEGDWPKTKKGALNESIRKWEWLVRGLEEGYIEIVPETGGETCALCELYTGVDVEENCRGCPVMKKTGLAQCKDTPFWDYHKLRDTYSILDALDAAKAEVKFLKSLK